MAGWHLTCLFTSVVSEAEALIAAVSITADSPSAVVPAMPNATAAPVASFGDLLMAQLPGPQVATVSAARSAFAAPAADLAATTSSPVAGKKAKTAPPSAGKALGTPAGEKSSGRSAGSAASTVVARFAMPLVAAQPPTFSYPEKASAQSLVSVSHGAQDSDGRANNEGRAGEWDARRNGDARPNEVAGQTASTSFATGLRRGDATTPPAGNAAIAAGAPPVELPGFSPAAKQAPASQNADPMVSSSGSGGELELPSSYSSVHSSATAAPAAAMPATDAPQTANRLGITPGLDAAAPKDNLASAYVNRSAAGIVTAPLAALAPARAAAAAPELRPRTSQAKPAFLAGVPPLAPAEAAAASPAVSAPELSAAPKSHPVLASQDPSRPAPAAQPAISPDGPLPPGRVGSGIAVPTTAAQTITAQAGIAPPNALTSTAGVSGSAPPLQGWDKNFHLTQDSAPLRPGPTAAPPPRSPAFEFRASPLNAKFTSAPDLATAIAASQPSQARVAADASPALSDQTYYCSPAARATDYVVDQTAWPASAVPRRTVSSANGDAATGTQRQVADAPLRTDPVAPQESAKLAPAGSAIPPAASPAISVAAWGQDQMPASITREAIAPKPGSTSAEVGAPTSDPTRLSPQPSKPGPAPRLTDAAAALSGQAVPATASNDEETQETGETDSAVTAQVDSLVSDFSLPNPAAPCGDFSAPGNVVAPETINVAGNMKPRQQAGAPADVSRKTAAAQAKPFSPAAADSSSQTQAPSFGTPESAVAAPDQAQRPAPAAGHGDQAAAAMAAQLIPLADSRQAPPHNGNDNGAVSNGTATPAAAGNLPRPADSVAPAPVLVQSARILEHIGQTEMRVGMNTADFGNLELRASVSQDQVGASIATAHAELRAALIAEMPSLERSLDQHQLRIDLLDPGAQPGGGSQERGSSAQQQPRSPAGFTTTSSSSLEAAAWPERPTPSSWSAPYSSGLNVHA